MRIMKIGMLVLCFLNATNGMEPGAPKASELIRAAQRGDCDAILKYKASGGDINATEFGYSALMKTVLYGHDEASELLLQLGASPDIQDRFGETILFYDRCSPEVFTAALLAKADPNIQDYRGRTVLMQCVQNRSFISAQSYRVALLLKHGAKIDITDSAGKTARDYAAEWLKKYLEMDASELEKVVASYK